MQDPTLAPWVTTSPTHSLATSQPIVSRHSRAPSWRGTAQGAKMTIDDLCRRELPGLRFRVLKALAGRPLVNPPGVRVLPLRGVLATRDNRLIRVVSHSTLFDHAIL